MNVDEALAVMNTLLQGQKLRDVQTQVFRYSWEGLTYPAIAQKTGYDTGHIRDVGSALWQLLSQRLGEPVTKKNVQTVLYRWQRQQNGAQQHDFPIITPTTHEYWDEMIDVSTFYGRDGELSQLKQWIRGEEPHQQSDQRCRLIAVVGMGGMGKTTLVAKLVEHIQSEFEFCIWQSLRNAPPIQDILLVVLQLLTHQQEFPIAEPVEIQLSRCLELLRLRRCLWVLDNVETILTSAESLPFPSAKSTYREGYEAYGELLRRVGIERHQSCLILTCREKPQTIVPLEGETLPVRSLSLTGLLESEIREIFKGSSFQDLDAHQWYQLNYRYSGNPLALRIVATLVTDLFDGNLMLFLEQGQLVFGDIQTLLEEQVNRLSKAEQSVMYWLAIHRESISLPELAEAVLPNNTPPYLLEILQSLVRRCLIEKQSGRFTLQPVVMEYLTHRLIQTLTAEIKTLKLDLFLSHALIQAQAKDYIRESQTRTLLAPLLEQLFQDIGEPFHLTHHLRQVLHHLKETSILPMGYGGGNVINLLRQMSADVTGYDFSGLCIRQAYCVGMDLQNVNFAHATFVKSVFSQTMAAVLTVRLSPEGDRLGVGEANGTLSVWQMSDHQCIWFIQAHGGQIQSLDWSPNGQTLVSGSADGTLKIWAQDGQLLQTLAGHEGWVRGVAWSPDGAAIASGSADGTIKLWAAETGEVLHTLQGHSDWVKSVAWNPEGSLLVSGSADGLINLWSRQTGKLLQQFNGEAGWVCSVAWSHDGTKLASGYADASVILWEVATGHLLHTLEGHGGWVWSVAWSPDDTAIATGSADCRVKLWDTVSGELERTLVGHTNQVCALDWSPDGQTLVSGGNDHQVKLWDLATGRVARTLQGQTHQVWSVDWSPDGTGLASGHNDGAIRIWDGQTGTLLHTLKGHSSWVRTVAWSPDGMMLASGSADGTIKLWDTERWQAVRSLHGHIGWVRSVAWHPSGTVLASGSHDHCIKLWNPSTGQLLKTLQGHTGGVWSVVWNPLLQANPEVEYSLASGSHDGTIRLWHLETGQPSRILQGHHHSVQSLTWSRCGQWLASGSTDCTVKVWKIATGEELVTLAGHTNWIGSVAWMPSYLENDQPPLLASGSDDHRIILWECQPQNIMNILEGHTNWVSAVAWTADGDRLASGSSDEQIKIWDVQPGHCLNTLAVPKLYHGMNLTGVSGLTEAQLSTLKSLGAKH
jgi:WD40 repeat protein